MTIQHFAQTWEEEQEKRERPCCKCIEPFDTPVHHSLLGMTEEEAKQDRQHKKELVQNCCGSDPKQHHESCRYYQNEQQMGEDWIEFLEQLHREGVDALDG